MINVENGVRHTGGTESSRSLTVEITLTGAHSVFAQDFYSCSSGVRGPMRIHLLRSIPCFHEMIREMSKGIAKEQEIP